MAHAASSPGLSGIVFGASWQSAAGRALIVFLVAYVLPAFAFPGSGATGFAQLLATVFCFAGAAIAIHRVLQARSAIAEAEFIDEATIMEEAPLAEAAVAHGPSDNSVVPVTATPEVPAPVADDPRQRVLGQAALERLSIALYRFNGLRSEMVATGVPGEYRIRLFPRNQDKATGLLLCSASTTPQSEEAYKALLQAMQEEGVEKAFFVAPAGFELEVVRVARSMHVTLVDHKLLWAMIDRLPAGAKEEAIAAAD